MDGFIFVEQEGIDQISRKVQAVISWAEEGRNLTVDVGYSAPYAVYVHEILFHWKYGTRVYHPIGNAKFLETPTREKSEEIFDRFFKSLKEGKSIPNALFDAGNLLLQYSQAECPVDTGKLRDSGFVRVHK